MKSLTKGILAAAGVLIVCEVFAFRLGLLADRFKQKGEILLSPMQAFDSVTDIRIAGWIVAALLLLDAAARALILSRRTATARIAAVYVRLYTVFAVTSVVAKTVSGLLFVGKHWKGERLGILLVELIVAAFLLGLLWWLDRNSRTMDEGNSRVVK